jgi:hypothetical protein
LRECLWHSCAEGFLVTNASLAKRCLGAAGCFPRRESHSQACGLCWLSRFSLDHIRFFRFALINSIRSPGQAALRKISDKFERETRFVITPLAPPSAFVRRSKPACRR